ncbi:MAG TPA: hypothetical protein VJ912_01570 [Candidatus Nanoarchaeia archaeon]|nr:hypothetical protein [Candidatus Nanoarchaeia archaeon]
MKVLKIIGIVFISIFLFLSLLAYGTTETLEKSTTFENMAGKVQSISKGFIQENLNMTPIINEALPYMQLYCINNTNYSFSQEGYEINIPCTIIEEGTDSIVSHIIDETIVSLIQKSYYQQYSCEFIECLQQQKPFILVSEKAHNYWKQKSTLFLLISIGLAALLFFLNKHKSNFFILSGGIILGNSIIISQLPIISQKITEKALMPVISTLKQLGMSSDIFVKIIGVFFSKYYEVYIWFLIIGIIFVAIGILLKFFNLAEKISHIFGIGKRK